MFTDDPTVSIYFYFVGITFEDYIIGIGNKPRDVYNDEKALFLHLSFERNSTVKR